LKTSFSFIESEGSSEWNSKERISTEYQLAFKLSFVSYTPEMLKNNSSEIGKTVIKCY
jgi:hypothetical protein